MRHLRPLRARRRRRAYGARHARAAAPRTGSGRHRQLRRPGVPRPPRAWSGGRQFRRPGDHRAARRRPGDRARALFDAGRGRAAQRAADLRRSRGRRSRHRAQRQPDQRAPHAPRSGGARLHLPVDDGYRGDRPSRRHQFEAHVHRPVDRRAAPGRRRLFVRHPHRPRADRGARPVRRAAAADRPPRRRHHPDLGVVRARHHRRHVRARRAAGRDRRRRRLRPQEPESVPADAAAFLPLRVHLLLAPRQHDRGAQRLRGAQARRRRAGARGQHRRRRRRPGAGFGRARGDRLRRAGRPALRARHRAQPLRRAHLHRAHRLDPPSRRQAEAQCQPGDAVRQAGDAGGRFDRPRHHLDQDRRNGAQRRRHRDPHAHRQSADRPFVLLRRRHARPRPAARVADGRGGDGPPHRRRQPRLHLDRRPLPRDGREGARPGAAAVLRRLLHRRLSDSPERPRRRRQPEAVVAARRGA